MKQFEVPQFYKSPLISRVKEARTMGDPRKRDFSPTLLDFGPVFFLIPRHFGFCYGVENAIEISYRAIEENPGKRIFLLSQMIHNPEVNADLQSHGITFIMDTEGNQFIPWHALQSDDIVIIPAFGTTVEIENLLALKGIETKKYNTTCPFVEKVWNRSQKLGKEKYTVIIHGKHNHEETRATFSHSYQGAPSLILKDMSEARLLGAFINNEVGEADFSAVFSNRISPGFDPAKDLKRVGVVNQTTMLASETQAIADYFKELMLNKFGPSDSLPHFADTRDTLCYATNDNQQATHGVLQHEADLAIVVGGYNSSNTSHIVELCEEKFPTYFIKSEAEIIDQHVINHFNYPSKEMRQSEWLPTKQPVRIVLTSGASCPDATVDRVMQKILSFFSETIPVEQVLENSLAK